MWFVRASHRGLVRTCRTSCANVFALGARGVTVVVIGARARVVLCFNILREG